MSLTVGTLAAILTLDSSQFDKGLQQTESSFRSLGDKLTGIAGTAAAGLGIALAGGLALAAKSGFEFNNSLEQASAKINAFTKDSAATAEVLEMVRQRAASTPFAFTEMANSAGALIPVANAAGVSLESMLETAEILAASNPAEGLEGAAFALREAVSGDFLSLMERFNIPKDLINDLKAQGVPNIEIVRQSLQKMGFDTDLVANLANTAQGRWSTFQDTLQGFAAQMTQPIFDLFSSGLGDVNNQLSALAPVIEPIAVQIGQNLAGAIQAVLAFIPTLVTWFVQLGGFIQSTVVPAISAIIAGFQSFVANNQPLISLIQANLMPILQGLAVVLGGAVVLSIGTAIAAFVSAVAPIVGLIAIASALFIAWDSNFLGIRDIVTSVMSALWSVISAIGSQILAFWNANGASILSFATTTWNQILSIVSGVLQIIGTVVSTVLSAIASFISKHGADIQAIFTTAFNNIRTIVQSVLAIVQGIVKTVLALMRGDFTSAWTEIKNIVTIAINAVKTIIQNNIELAKRIWANNSDAIKKKASETWDSIVNTLRGMVGSFASAASDIGSAIIDGIVNGISAGAGAIADAARNAAQSALNAAKRLLGIKSPSSVFRDEVAGNVIKGMALGLRDTAPITAAMNGLVGTMTGVPLNTGASMSNQTNWNVNINTTQPITSVLGGLELRQSLIGN